MSLFTELKRRNVLRIAAAYIAVSWLLIQVVETLFPVFNLSDEAIRSVVIALAIGFFPAVVVAWIFELTPSGLLRDSGVDDGSKAAASGTKRLDILIMVSLALAVGYFAFDKFLLDPERDRAIAEAAKEAGRDEVLQASHERKKPVLAVLPFSALTDAEDSAFFAAGVHDDLLTKLAKLPSLLVISRTSVLEFKNSKENIRSIGSALGADAILEGGVQSAGNRIRINAQLIDAKTDEHLWAETYDRELTTQSIFDVQEEIAASITESLHLTLGVSADVSLIPTANMQAYRAYHEAIMAREANHGGITSGEYRDLLHKAFELDPTFTRPMALLIGSFSLEAFGGRTPELLAEVDHLLAELQSTAPDSADYVISQTYYAYYILKDYDLALQFADRALEMAPSDSYLHAIRGWIQRRQGDTQGHLESLKMARQLEPSDDRWTQAIIRKLVFLHRYNEASVEIDALQGRDPSARAYGIMLSVREHGDLEKLRSDMQSLADELGEKEASSAAVYLWMTRYLVRDYRGAAEALQEIPLPESSIPPRMGLENRQALEMMTYWSMGDEQRVARLIAQARENSALLRAGGVQLKPDLAVTRALVAAVQGDTLETQRLLELWFRDGAQDLAGRDIWWQSACQILGIAGAGEAAVNCIRRGLEIPSEIMPFIELSYPMYDPVRNHPGFVALARELKNAD